MDNRTGLFTNMIIWFGVAISVSEIQAGIQIASAAPLNSIWVPLILGHLIGGVLLYFVGLIGARLRVNAMESIKSTFGNFGSKFFASLNVLQLIAWVAVLNAQGAILCTYLHNSGCSYSHMGFYRSQENFKNNKHNHDGVNCAACNIVR